MKSYAEETKARFGNTDAYKEFEQKTAEYSKEKFEQANKGLDAILAKFAQCKSNGHSPDSAEAQNLVIGLQSHITEHYYTCTDEILKNLGVMYTADERFKENIDKHGLGTAEFISSAIEIY